MPFEIIYGDILKVETDAIVNSTNAFFSGNGGLDRKINEAAGDMLWEACGHLGRLHKGEAKITEGFGLAPRKIIHTSGPHWKGGMLGEISLLKECYINSILLARKEGLGTIAFPLISSRINGFPKSVALTAALKGIQIGLSEVEDSINVKLVIYREKNPKEDAVLEDIVNQAARSFEPRGVYDDFVEVDESEISFYRGHSSKRIAFSASKVVPTSLLAEDPEQREGYGYKPVSKWFDAIMDSPTQKNFKKVTLDLSFGETLKRLMEEKGFSKTKMADELGMSGPGLWKIITDKSIPNRLAVFSMILILKLDMDEATDLLMKAGYSFSSAFYTDLIIQCCVQRGFYDRNKIDELLYSLDLQPLPGAILD
ncbi:MAG: macro domain-containing protein [Spirochaetales bacterium]|nr:macro domain-containing protein [Spirochaetales bacterium]